MHMLKFDTIKEGVNSSRSIMVAYLIQAVKATENNLIEFSNKVDSISWRYDDSNKFTVVKPVSLSMFDETGTPSNTHCVLAFKDRKGQEDSDYIHYLTSDNLYTLCEMVYGITKDNLPEERNIHEVVDLTEKEYEILN